MRTHGTSEIKLINPFTGENLLVTFLWVNDYSSGDYYTPEVDDWSYGDFDVIKVDGEEVSYYFISDELYDYIESKVREFDLTDLV